jgi:chemotaxis signal transduction protein
METAENQGLDNASEDIYLLLFELDGQLYGVDVAQVETIIEGQTRDGLWSYQGQEMAAQDLALWVGLEASGEDKASRVLLSWSNGALRGFLVNTPKDIVALPPESVFAIPPLIQRVSERSPFWGVAQGPKGLILLVDLTAERGLSESIQPAPGEVDGADGSDGEAHRTTSRPSEGAEEDKR